MSDNRSSREKITRLTDALLEDIITAPVEDILSEVNRAEIDRGRSILKAATQEFSRRGLVEAQAAYEAWTILRSTEERVIDPTDAKILFEKIKAGDPEFNKKIMLAARKGETPSDADVVGISDDYSDLDRLDKDDEEK